MPHPSAVLMLRIQCLTGLHDLLIGLLIGLGDKRHQGVFPILILLKDVGIRDTDFARIKLCFSHLKFPPHH